MRHVDSDSELLEIINAGDAREHLFTNLELKESWNEKGSGPKLSKLANVNLDRPSYLVIGVRDDGTACTTTEGWAKKTELTVSQHINRYLEPQQTSLSVTASALSATRTWVVIVKVENPGAVVFWDGKAYKGAGTVKDRMSEAEVMELTVRLPGLKDYTRQYADTSQVDEELVMDFCRSVRGRQKLWPDQYLPESEDTNPRKVLQRTSLWNVRAARILFGDHSYRLVAYDQYEEVAYNEEFKGLLGVFSDKILSFVQSWGPRGQAEYPRSALKESLANAVAHAAHHERYGELLIEVRWDSFSVGNLCYKSSLAFANKWFSQSRFPSNPTLMQALRLGGYVDELGRGKYLILSECLRAGHPPPKVVSEPAGHLSRWRLVIQARGGRSLDRRLLDRLREYYDEEKMALLALALVYWRNEPLQSIVEYIDEESQDVFASVVSDPAGPLVVEEDSISAKRWVEVLLGEGKDSKSLSPQEERGVIGQIYDFSRKNSGEFRVADIRRIAGMGNSRSEQVLSSSLARKWKGEGLISGVRHGVYRFDEAPPRPASHSLDVLRKILGRSQSSQLAIQMFGADDDRFDDES